MTEAVQLDAPRSLSVARERAACEGATKDGRQLALLCRVRHDVLCALPLEYVEETMRPLAVQPMAGVPSFVQGLTVVRGDPTPVVNVACLLGNQTSHATRFVTVRTGTRRVVLAVEAVVGVIQIPSGLVDALPPLLQNAELEAISAIGVLEAALLLVLRSSSLIPADVWTTIQTGGVSA